MNKPMSLCKALLCTIVFAACLEPLPDGEPVTPGEENTGGGSGSGSGSGTNPPPTTSAKFDAWMKCMTLSDFRTSNFYGVWTAMQAEEQVLCQACHENGGDGFITTSNEGKFFDTVKTNKYYARMYFTYTTTEPFSVDANQVVMDSVAYGQQPHAEHPRFNPSPGLNVSRVFAQMTTQRYLAGNCGP